MYFSLILDSKSKPTLIKLVFIFCSLFCCPYHDKCGCKVWIIRPKESKKMRDVSLGSFKRYNLHLNMSKQANKNCLGYLSSSFISVFPMNIRTSGAAIHSGKALMTVCVQRGQTVHDELFLGRGHRAWEIIYISLGDHCHNLDESEGISMSGRKVTLGKEINTSQRQKSMIVVDCDEKGTESQLDWSKIRYHVHLKKNSIVNTTDFELYFLYGCL